MNNNYENEQCRDCKFLHKIVCHPSNKNLGYGNISTIFGFVCTVGLDGKIDDPYYFFEDDKGTCELFQTKENTTILNMKDELITFEVPESEIEDYTSETGWNIRGDYYKFIEKNITNCDGHECFKVITQRKTDNKFFSFGYCSDEFSRNFYEPEWTEVKPKTKVVYE